jgi:hypothetical protein
MIVQFFGRLWAPWVLIAFYALILLSLGTSAHAQDRLTVLIDGSGSMRGYFRTAAISNLVKSLIESAQSWTVTSEVFVSNIDEPNISRIPLAEWPTDARSSSFGKSTRLDVLVRALQPGEAYVIVTDNFQDEGKAIGRTGEFYAQLHGSALSQVYLVPALLPFDGRVEFAPGIGIPAGPGRAEQLRTQILAATHPNFLGQGGRIDQPEWLTPGNTTGRWRVGYKGLRGLAVYLIRTARTNEDGRFDAWADELGRRLDAPPLLVHPLGRGAVRLQASIDARPDPQALRCAGLAAADLPTPNLTLDAGESGSAGQQYSLGLMPGQARTYDPRQSSRFVAVLEVVTTEDHVRLAATGDCKTAARLEASPLQVTVPEAQQGILLPEADRRPRSDALPAHLVGSLDPRAKASRSVFLVLDLPALVGPEVSPGAFGGQLEARLELSVMVPRSAWQMAPEVRARYFTETPLDLARIFSPTDLVQVLAPAEGVTLRIPMSVKPDVVNATQPVAKAELPWGAMLGLLGALLGLSFLWSWLLPLGFAAPVRCGQDPKIEAEVGGFLRNRTYRFELPDGIAIRFERARLFGRTLRVLQDDHPVGDLRPGHALDLEGCSVRYMNANDVKTYKKGFE